MSIEYGRSINAQEGYLKPRSDLVTAGLVAVGLALSVGSLLKATEYEVYNQNLTDICVTNDQQVACREGKKKEAERNDGWIPIAFFGGLGTTVYGLSRWLQYSRYPGANISAP